MKRILILTITLLSVALLSVVPTFAAESFELIPSGADWVKTDNGGASVAVEESDGVFVFSGSVEGSWPCTTAMYTGSPVVAALDSYSLVYDFTVEGGATNINFFFDNGNGGTVDYTICNSMFADRYYDTGSGDLYTGEFKGAIKLSDFVETSRLYNNEAFPVDAIVDGSLHFVGVQVYSVNGAKITVKTMDIVHNDDVVAEAPSEESVSEAESSAEESAEESTVSVETEESAVTSETEESTDSPKNESSAVTSAPAEDTNNVDSTSVLVTVIAIVAIPVCIIVAVLLKKKQSK